jgi:hypothetical protein
MEKTIVFSYRSIENLSMNFVIPYHCLAFPSAKAALLEQYKLKEITFREQRSAITFYIPIATKRHEATA